MRERLTLSFVLVVVAVVVCAFMVRASLLNTELDHFEQQRIEHEARVASTLVDERVAHGEPVDAAFLSSIVDTGDQLTFAPAGGAMVVVDGAGPRVTSSDTLTSSIATSTGTLSVRQSAQVVRPVVDGEQDKVRLLLLIVALVAAAVGFLISLNLSRPFRQLAVAAGALGRGRFDLDLPRTRIPEATEISRALAASADRIQGRLAREQEFAQHTSHVLRTPLTGLQLELEYLALRDDLPEDARETSARCLARVAEMEAVADELVQLTRGSRLVDDVQVSLRDLATGAAQHWADRLVEHDRALTAAVDGEIDLTYTPGPIEQILDLLLLESVRHGGGATRLVFDADPDGALLIRATCAEPATRTAGAEDGSWVARARAVAMALGGRLEGDDPVGGFEVLLPRR